MKRAVKPAGLAGTVLVAALALTGCGAVESTADAATVGDGAVTVDEFEQLLQTFAANPEVTGLNEDLSTGTVAGTDARQWLTVMVKGEANEQFLAAAGEPISDADRQELLDTVPADNPILDFPESVVQLLVDAQAGTTAQARIAAPDAAELQRLYEDDPSSLGVLCVSHVLLDTEAEAEAVVDELEGGASIADVAAERSTDPTAADNGGAIEATEGGGCIPITTARTSLDATFLAAAVGAKPGEVVGPVQTDFGWHVIEARPYDEVADSLTTLFSDSAGALLFDGYLATAEIRVDPRYGRWDPLSSSVIAL